MRRFKKWAFLVGVSKYIYGFPNLDFATKHVNNIKRILKSSGEFEEPIVILTEESDKQHQPSKVNIMIQYAKLLKKIQPNDLLFAYFLSHGGLFPPWEQKKCMFPSDSSKESGPILDAASIPLSYFYEHEISKYPYQTWKVFFFFDICQCYTDIQSMEWDVKDHQKSEKFDEMLGIEPIEIIEGISDISQFYAGSSNERAFTFKKEGEEFSVFSYALIKGLSGGVKPPVTYGRLVKFVKEEIKNIRNLYIDVPFQTPMSISNESANNTVLIGDGQLYSEEEATESIESKITELKEKLNKFTNSFASGRTSEKAFENIVKLLEHELEKLDRQKL